MKGCSLVATVFVNVIIWLALPVRADEAAAELAQLQSLQLHHCGVGDDDLAPLAGMPKLKSLFVSSQFNGRLTDAGLKHLVQIQTLESLKLAEFVVTSEGGLDVLMKLGRLKTLELLKVGIAATDIEKLRAAMPKTEIQWTAASPSSTAGPPARRYHTSEYRGRAASVREFGAAPTNHGGTESRRHIR